MCTCIFSSVVTNEYTAILSQKMMISHFTDCIIREHYYVRTLYDVKSDYRVDQYNT